MQWAVQQDFVHVVDLEMIDLVVLQKFIVIVSLSLQALGI